MTHWFIGDSVLVRYTHDRPDQGAVRVFGSVGIEWGPETPRTYTVEERGLLGDVVIRSEKVQGLEAAMALAVEWLP